MSATSIATWSIIPAWKIFGFKIDIVTFLTGMTAGKGLGDLFLAIIKHVFEISKGDRLDPGHKPDIRCFQVYRRTNVEDLVTARCFNQAFEKMACVPSMGAVPIDAESSTNRDCWAAISIPQAPRFPCERSHFPMVHKQHRSQNGR